MPGRQRPGRTLGRLPAKPRCGGGDTAHFRDATIAMEHEIAAGGINRPCPGFVISRECLHRHIIAHQQPIETDSFTDDTPDYGW